MSPWQVSDTSAQRAFVASAFHQNRFFSTEAARLVTSQDITRFIADRDIRQSISIRVDIRFSRSEDVKFSITTSIIVQYSIAFPPRSGTINRGDERITGRAQSLFLNTAVAEITVPA